ncbi:MAG TPA: bifunctional nuclease family protein [Candidatus Acetothermia bacterium]|nr:bifunctional nuclease family protein [Candidatus Acetothermia bacterium]
MREVVIKALLVDPSSQMPVVLLKDKASQKALPIWIGETEAVSIAIGLQSDEFPRPLTHVLMKQMLEKLNARVEKVVILELQGGTYLASIFVRDMKGEIVEFDARPSDGLALSLRTGCQVFVNDEVFRAESIDSPFAEEDEFHEFVDYNLDLGEFRRQSGDPAS